MKRVLTENTKQKISLAVTGKGRNPIPIGTHFGRLTVISDGFRNHKRHNRYYVTCKCDCGTIKDIAQNSLRQTQTKSCGCLWHEKIAKGGWNKLADSESAFRTLYRNYRNRAEQKELDFNLSPLDFKHLVVQDCHYCGKSPSQKINSKYNGAFIYNGIDRKNNKIGYIEDNCVACCKDCNTLKRNLSYDEFIKYFTKIYYHWAHPYIGIIAGIEDNIEVYSERV